MAASIPERPVLKRSLSLPLIALYGLGTTIGAGIYALTGEVAGLSGMAAPLAFGVASLLAAFTAFSFAELSSRFPHSAGEAVYVRQGLGRRHLGTTVGLLVALAGSVSAATIANGFVGYLTELAPVPRSVAITTLVIGLGGLAAWGIRESVLAAAAITLVETGGLFLVLWGARTGLGELPQRWPEIAAAVPAGAGVGVLSAALLAFYAFLGFEDMVNVAEEVKRVRRNLPLAIVLVLIATTLLYVVLGLASVLTVPPHVLAASDAPLSLVYEQGTGRSPMVITVIGIGAMVNGALVQVIMASRVLYGLADQGALPRRLAAVHQRTRTPLIATALVTGLVLTLALFFPLAPLARATSLITLVVFTLVNLALFQLKRRQPTPAGAWCVPLWVPLAGVCVSLGFLAFEAARRLP